MNLTTNKISNQNKICQHLSNKISSKEAVFSEKKVKNYFWRRSPFWSKKATGKENEYSFFFMENEVLNIFSSNNFFEECNIF